MLNILHLTDFHYSRRNQYDQSFIIKALLDDLAEVCGDSGTPDLLVFSGDLVDRADEKNAFPDFFDEVLEPIMKVTRCGEARVILTPGNHDVSRTYTKSNKDRQDGLVKRLTSREEANSALLSGELNDFVEGKLAGYRELRDYIGYSNVRYRTPFSSLRVYDELRTAVVQINTAWLGYTGLDEIRDERSLWVPEAAVELALREVPSGYTTVLVGHHPFNWLTEISESDLHDTVDGKIALHLHGHMHEARPSQMAGFKGRAFSVQGGALYQGRKRYVGYSLIRLDQDSGHGEVQFRSYFDKPARAFGPATDLVPNKAGKVHTSADAEQFFHRVSKRVDRRALQQWIDEVVLPDAEIEFGEGLTERKTTDLFVPPPLYISSFKKVADEPLPEYVEEPITFDEIRAGRQNYIVIGGGEFGKTTLLQQLALSDLRSSTADNPRVAACINFSGIKKGEKRIEALIRSALPDFPDTCQLSQLLSEGLVVLIVDDVNFTDVNRIDVLEQFMKENTGNRFILSSPAGKNDRILSSSAADLPVHFTRIHLKPLRRKELRTLVEKWDSEQKRDHTEILDRLVVALKGMNVPITAVNGTILLSIYETQSDFTPINRSVLIEHFIETLLDKSKASNASRKSFDFRNRMDYLSYIAKTMTTNNEYVLPYDTILSVTSEYLKSLGLLYEPSTLVGEFLDAKILVRRPDGRVSFKYRAFLEYFIASRMIQDRSFKDWIFEPSRYLSFFNELSYYSGLVRNDLAMLNELGARLDELSPSVFATAPNLNLLDEFALPPTGTDSDQMLDEIASQIDAPALSDQERDDILEADLPHDVEGRQEVFRPDPKDAGIRWFTALMNYSSVLKNMELIPDADKRRHLQHALTRWSWLYMSSLWAVPQIARTRHIRVNGILFRVAVPAHFTEGEVARVIYCDLPNAISKLVFTYLGTEKFESQLMNPDLSEVDEPKFVRFLRDALVVDLRLGDWLKRVQSLFGDLRKNRYLLEASIWKVSDVFRLGAVKGKAREEMQVLLAGAVTDLKGGTEEEKKRRKERQLNRYRIQDLVRRLKAGEDE